MDKVGRKFINPSPRQTSIRQLPDYSLSLSLPYHPTLSKPLKKILRQHDIKVTNTSTSLRDLLTKTKMTPALRDFLPRLQFYLQRLDLQTYIPLIHRMKEHERCYRLNNAYDDTLDKIKSAPTRHSHYWTQNCLERYQHPESPTLASHLDLIQHAAIHFRNPSMNKTDSAPKCSSLWNPVLPKIAETH